MTIQEHTVLQKLFKEEELKLQYKAMKLLIIICHEDQSEMKYIS